MKLTALLLTTLVYFSCTYNSGEEIAKSEIKNVPVEGKFDEEKIVRDSNRYYNEELNISVIKPEGWEIKENYQNIPVFFMSPMGDSNDLFQENINMVSENAPGYSLKQYYEANIAGINQYLTDFKIIKQPVDTTINGHQFKRMVYEHSSQNYVFKVLIVFAVKNGKGYVINCTASHETYNDYYNDFNSFIESFRFE